MSLSASHSGLVMRLYRWLWMGRIQSLRPSVPPGAVIFAAHYNGLVDGFVYGSQSPPALGVISVQWHRHFIGRLMFPGIAVQRAKDAGKGGDNLGAFRQMVAAVAAGERLLFFPEGTSRLGTARLPVARGTLLLLKSLRRIAPVPPIFFVAAHYHGPTRWKSDVSLGWLGPLVPPQSATEDERWVSENLLAAQSLAYAPPAPRRFGLTFIAGLLALPYLPLWLAVRAAALRVADDDNVISLWKFLFGVPTTALLLLVYTAVASWCGVPWWTPLASLAAGWLLWNR